jgi:hypothetical protein
VELTSQGGTSNKKQYQVFLAAVFYEELFQKREGRFKNSLETVSLNQDISYSSAS